MFFIIKVFWKVNVGVRTVYQDLCCFIFYVFCVLFCRRLFVRLLFLWPLYCLFFYNGQKNKRRTNNLLQNTTQKTKSCISKNRQYNGQKNKRRYCLFFDIQLFVFCGVFCRRLFVVFYSFGHCIVCSSIYSFLFSV
jgi:hypothetical protein